MGNSYFTVMAVSHHDKERKYMDWIFGAFLIASMLRMAEEYFYPGGSMDIMKHLNPRFSPFVTVSMA